MKDKFFKYLHELQDTITSKLEIIDGSSVFREDLWKRPEGGGLLPLPRSLPIFWRVRLNGVASKSKFLALPPVHGKAGNHANYGNRPENQPCQGD